MGPFLGPAIPLHLLPRHALSPAPGLQPLPHPPAPLCSWTWEQEKAPAVGPTGHKETQSVIPGLLLVLSVPEGRKNFLPLRHCTPAPILAFGQLLIISSEAEKTFLRTQRGHLTATMRAAPNAKPALSSWQTLLSAPTGVWRSGPPSLRPPPPGHSRQQRTDT